MSPRPVPSGGSARDGAASASRIDAASDVRRAPGMSPPASTFVSAPSIAGNPGAVFRVVLSSDRGAK